MDPRTVAHALTRIAAFLELRGESTFKCRAYEQAARSVAALDTDDLAAMDRNGTLALTPGLGKATLSVVRDLIETGESRYLAELQADLPPGMPVLLKVPGLAVAKVHLLHEQLGIDSVDALETAAHDGRIAGVKGFGPKTAAKILRGIEMFRASGTLTLYHRGAQQARTLLAAVLAHPGVLRAEIAGSVRRHCETVGATEIVAACGGDPLDVAASFARAPGVRAVIRENTISPQITFMDGVQFNLHCVADADFAVALWRHTGSPDHVDTMRALLAREGITMDGDALRSAQGGTVAIATEAALYKLVGLPFIHPEMREEGNEFLLAVAGQLPVLLDNGDIRGALHCHSTWSDGKPTIAELAEAARVRGWSYIGITDHSQAAFYAGGMARDRVLQQHDEIDALNAVSSGVRILKGIEADILADGALDYDPDLLDCFDFVVGSIHSRFAMDRQRMTERVLRALDDPHLTVLGHPTGRLLLSRDPFPIDMDAVLEKAGAIGVAVELNADPKRLDLDWRYLARARQLGVAIEIGPDAHSVNGLDNMAIGVGMARKAGIEAKDVLNARGAVEVLAFARARRAPLR